MTVCTLFVVQGDAQDKKVDAKDKVGALPPHPMDKTFEKATNVNNLTNALLNDKLFREAVKNAVAAKQKAEALQNKQPNMVGPSSAQAARQAFLRTMQVLDTVEEKKVEEKKVQEKKVDEKKNDK